MGTDAPAGAPDQPPLLSPTPHGPGLAWRGVSFYPSPDPKEYARRKARVFSPRPGTLFFVPSIGLGYGLGELLDSLPERSAVLCIELYQEIMAIAASAKLPEDPRLLVVRTSERAGALAALRRLGVHRFRRVVVLPLCAGYRLAPGRYEELQQALEESIRRFWQNRLTLIALGSLQVRNLLSNLPVLRDASDFASLRTGMPVLVAGAGPSLEKSLSIMGRLRERFVLAAVDTALPTLHAAGLSPDLVVALEAQTANLQDFIGSAGGGNALLACDLSSHPGVVRLFGGRVSFFSSVFAPLTLFDRLEQAGLRPAEFPPLGSVGVAAVHAALRITCAEVFLTGLDFSYPGSRTHARGSPSHLAMLRRAARTRPVGQDGFRALAARPLLSETGKRGGSVTTDTLMRSYRDSLSEELGDAGDRVADIGENGLPLGAVLIDEEEMESRLRTGLSGGTLQRDGSRRFSGDRVAGFLRAEHELLGRASQATLASAGVSAEERAALLRDIDYAWVHFPDLPDLQAPSPGFLARVRVAAGWYSQRISRMLSVL